ncbi:MAG: malto-oligosyltrehalose trehalohydrolase [Phycisphaeraceae bacterium]|nr:MAG: malto-oligosyltrehalose trehalohydrolase [Phycisphaeraceae bacterium]
MSSPDAHSLGASLRDESVCDFLLWAPHGRRVELRLHGGAGRGVTMDRDAEGYHFARVEGVQAGDRYSYVIDGGAQRPDPASRLQPDGVHGPSAVMNPDFPWKEQHWIGLPLAEYVIYELHVGAFTEDGTFDAVIPRLDALQDLGVTAIELMPIAQFPGDRNWGYDGVQLFAAHSDYGGPDGLRRLIDACHARGLAVVLDVVYNHLGPEGNYLREFGPYFTGSYATPWGEAINFDNAGSDEVRRFFIENALFWIDDMRIDALRLDAVHAIRDHTARTFLEDLSEAVHERAARLGRRIHLIAESCDNDPRLIIPQADGGVGMDAVWNDDFHHALHALLTGERQGYYADFGPIDHFARAMREGFVYTGQRSAYRGRRHGASSKGLPGERFVVFAQNHDQAGNRMQGERLSGLVSFEAQKLAAGATLLAPFVPLLFMGEEYGETAPFLFFVSHGDESLIEAVRKGRREEFASFGWEGAPPDPQDPSTFQRSRLNRALLEHPRHRMLLDLHRELLRLRREVPALRELRTDRTEVSEPEGARALLVRRWADQCETVHMLNFSDEPLEAALPGGSDAGGWRLLLDTADAEWGGPGDETDTKIAASASGDPSVVRSRPWSCTLFIREDG